MRKQTKNKLLKLLVIAVLLVITIVIPICIMAAVETPEDGIGDNEQEVPLNTSSISGKLWHDANADGIRDGDEPSIAGYLVSLHAQGDAENAVQTTVTDADGRYTFSHMEPDSYVVRVNADTVGGTAYLVPTAGITADNQFICPNGDENATFALSNPVAIELDTEATNVNAGMRTIPELLPAQQETGTQANSISGKVWHDVDQNGRYDAGEPPIANYRVYLCEENDFETVVHAAETDANGQYTFTNIEPGLYVVKLSAATANGTDYIVPTNGIATDNQFVCPNPSTDNPFAISTPFEMAPDTVAMDINAGMWTPVEQPPAQQETDPQGQESDPQGQETDPQGQESDPQGQETDPQEAAQLANSISGKLWHDANESGTYDAGEQLIANYRVGLLLESDSQTVVRATETDANGQYTFANVEPGTYVVGVKAATVGGVDYLVPTVGTALENKFANAEAGTDKTVALSIPIEMGLHTVAADINAGMRTIDAAQNAQGLLVTGTNSISGKIWHDVGGSGKFDGTDYLLVDYPVYLYREDDTANAVLTTKTDADGRYAFTNVEPGSYVVGVKPVKKFRLEYTAPTAGITEENAFPGGDADKALALSVPITLEANTAVTNINAGMREIDEFPRPAASQGMSISPMAYVDGDVAVDKSKSAADLVDMLVGTGIQTSSISIVGSPNCQYGVFKNGKDVFGIDTGIVLSTGNASYIQPSVYATTHNYSYGATEWASAKRDSDLEAELFKYFGRNYVTADACILEFDFVPETAYFTFDYVFASEEYNEFVDIGYNDVFGFFINGKNYALVPGSNAIVSVDSVNYKSNVPYFVNNNPHKTPAYYPDYGPFVNIPDLKRTEMDGFTVVMNIQAKVNPGVTNHIKLAIADVSDRKYDANVLIAGARSELPTVWLDPTSIVVYEDVAGGSVSFTVHRDITLDKSEVDFTLTDGTAIAGVDYVDVSQTVVFNAGEASKVVTIPIHNRNGFQGDRSFTVKLESPNECKIGNPYEGTVTILEVENKPESFNVTEKFVDQNGVVFDPINLPNNIVNVVVGNNYTASGIPTSHTMANGDIYEYRGYKWDTYTAVDTPTSGTPSNVSIASDRDVYYVYEKKAHTSVQVSKAVFGDYAVKTKDFTFTIYFTDASGQKLAAGTQFHYTGEAFVGSGATAPASGTLTLDGDGKQTFTLRHGQSITIAGVAVNGKVRIVEEASPDYVVSFKDSELPHDETSADTGLRDMTATDRYFAFNNTKTDTPPTGISTGGMKPHILLIMSALVVAAGLTVGKRYVLSKSR